MKYNIHTWVLISVKLPKTKNFLAVTTEEDDTRAIQLVATRRLKHVVAIIKSIILFLCL